MFKNMFSSVSTCLLEFDLCDVRIQLYMRVYQFYVANAIELDDPFGYMTSLIIETTVMFLPFYLRRQHFRTLERIDSNQPYYTTLV